MNALFPAVAFDDFEDFWSAVPRKVGKIDARKAYRLARKHHTGQLLKEAVMAYAKSRDGQPREFILHPASWLRGERWNDQDVVADSTTDSIPLPERIWADKVAIAKMGLTSLRHAPSSAEIKLMLANGQITQQQADKWPLTR